MISLKVEFFTIQYLNKVQTVDSILESLTLQRQFLLRKIKRSGVSSVFCVSFAQHYIGEDCFHYQWGYIPRREFFLPTARRALLWEMIRERHSWSVTMVADLKLMPRRIKSTLLSCSSVESQLWWLLLATFWNVFDLGGALTLVCHALWYFKVKIFNTWSRPRSFL